MPEFVPTITKNPSVRFPSTWRDAIGKPLTDSAILAYIREGRYGPDLQRRQLARDHATIVQGRIILARKCCECDNLGNFMRFNYLPKAGYYCDHCRNVHKSEKEQAERKRRAFRDGTAFE